MKYLVYCVISIKSDFFFDEQFVCIIDCNNCKSKKVTFNTNDTYYFFSNQVKDKSGLINFLQSCSNCTFHINIKNKSF
jgi:hypothetical protein